MTLEASIAQADSPAASLSLPQMVTLYTSHTAVSVRFVKSLSCLLDNANVGDVDQDQHHGAQS
jgi:hypothetical protein